MSKVTGKCAQALKGKSSRDSTQRHACMWDLDSTPHELIS